jgi:hypothetical protein
MIDANYLSALGRITVALSLDEWLMAQIVAVLTDRELEVGEMITAQMMFKNRTRLIYSLFKHKYGDGRAGDLSKILDRGISLYHERNRYIHSFWYESAGHVQRLKISAKWTRSRGHHEDKEPVTFEQLNTLADNLEQFGQDLSDFIGSTL